MYWKCNLLGILEKSPVRIFFYVRYLYILILDTSLHLSFLLLLTFSSTFPTLVFIAINSQISKLESFNFNTMLSFQSRKKYAS